jgi:hypothetical protein
MLQGLLVKALVNYSVNSTKILIFSYFTAQVRPRAAQVGPNDDQDQILYQNKE